VLTKSTQLNPTNRRALCRCATRQTDRQTGNVGFQGNHKGAPLQWANEPAQHSRVSVGAHLVVALTRSPPASFNAYATSLPESRFQVSATSPAHHSE